MTYGIALPAWKTVFVVTPKAACTSFLWSLAEVQSEDLALFSQSLSPEVTQSLTIHDRRCWHRTPTLDTLDDEALAAIASPDWFIFSVVRDPLARVWSAWQSKLLMREPEYARMFEHRAWFPRVPENVDQLREDFARFVEALSEDPVLLASDVHWAPLCELLRLDCMPYTHIGRVEDIGKTWDALERHLERQGWTGVLSRQHENASLLPVPDDIVDRVTLQRIAAIYASDYDQFSYQPPAPRITASPDSHVINASDTLRAIRHLIARHERIRVFYRATVDSLDLLDASHFELLRARADLEGARAQLAGQLDVITRQEEALHDSDRTLAELARASSLIEEELSAIRNSRTMRYTAPARKLCSVLRRLIALDRR